MSNSFKSHGVDEISKQLRVSMKKNSLDTIVVQVTRLAGKLKVSFTGSPEQVGKAEEILAAWA